MINDPDFILIERILSGETALYGGIVDRYQRYVYTIAARILADRNEAEEAAQDAFIKAFQALKAFHRESKFSTWLYRIAFNTAVSYSRKHRKGQVSIEKVVVAIDHEGENEMERADKKRFLDEALARLNEADRTALTLFYLRELSLEEIAEVTGMPANTAKVRIHRARQKMAEELKTILNREALTL
jgi:RNA polymerase sigma factor (sigma-70 family)